MIDGVLGKIGSLLTPVKTLWENKITPRRYYLFIGYRENEIDLLLLERRLFSWQLQKYGSTGTEDSPPQSILQNLLDRLFSEVPDITPANLEIYVGLSGPFMQVYTHSLPGYLTDEEIPEKINQTVRRRPGPRHGIDMHTSWVEIARTEEHREFRIAAVTERAVHTILDTLNEFSEAVAGIGPVDFGRESQEDQPSLTWQDIRSEEDLSANFVSLLDLYRASLLYVPENQQEIQWETRGAYQFRRAIVGWGIILLGFVGLWGAGNLTLVGYDALSGTAEAEETQQFAKYQGLVRTADALQDTLQTLTRLYRYRSTHAWLFHQLEPLWPPSMSLEELTLETTGSDTIRLRAAGRVSNDEELYTFLRQSGQQPFVAGVQLQQVRKNNPRFSRFTVEIACNF